MMEAKLFERLLESVKSPSTFSQPNKSMVFGVSKQLELIEKIKLMIPGSSERYTAVCTYVNLACGSFARAVYEPGKHKEPNIVWTDFEYPTDGFSEFIADLCNKDFSQQTTDPT